MTEDEYWNTDDDYGEHNDEDEILYEFLIDEPDDLTLVMMPKFNFNLEEVLESYYKQIKKCKNKEQLISALRVFYAHISGIVLLQNDIQYLQDRAKEIEFNIQMMSNEYS